MTTATLSIDLNAIAANWQALNKMTGCDTGAVIKANAYGLGIDRVAPVLAAQGARKFFVAVAEEGVALRRVLGPGPAINVFAGHMPGDADMIRSAALTPMINSVAQMIAHVEALPGHRFGVQLNSGMNRLGMDPAEWAALRDIALAQNPTLIMSHLACADEPNHPMNARQLKTFREMTDGLVREVATGQTVGYGCAWTAPRPTLVATVAAGYADGLIRALGNGATFTHEGRQLPVVGRVSMDLITVDVTSLTEVPEHLQLIGNYQSVDTVAGFAGTIGYEVLTALGARYDRVYVE